MNPLIFVAGHATDTGKVAWKVTTLAQRAMEAINVNPLMAVLYMVIALGAITVALCDAVAGQPVFGSRI